MQFSKLFTAPCYFLSHPNFHATHNFRHGGPTVKMSEIQQAKVAVADVWQTVVCCLDQARQCTCFMLPLILLSYIHWQLTSERNASAFQLRTGVDRYGDNHWRSCWTTEQPWQAWLKLTVTRHRLSHIQFPHRVFEPEHKPWLDSGPLWSYHPMFCVLCNLIGHSNKICTVSPGIHTVKVILFAWNICLSQYRTRCASQIWVKPKPLVQPAWNLQSFVNLEAVTLAQTGLPWSDQAERHTVYSKL